MCSGLTLTSTQLLFGPTRVTTWLVTSIASTVATMEITPASLSISTGPAFAASINKSDRATTNAPFSAATSNVIITSNTDIRKRTTHYQLKVTPINGPS